MTSSIRKFGGQIGFKHIILLIVGTIIIFLAFSYAGFSETIKSLYAINPLIISAFILSRAAIYLLGNYRWKIFADKLERVGFAKLLPIYFSGMILDSLIPGPGFGGEPVKAYYLSKLIKKKFSECFATALMDSVVFALTLFGFLAFSIAYVFLYVKISIIRQLIGAIILALVAALIFLYYVYSRKRDGTFIDKILGFFYKNKFLKKRFAKYGLFKDYLAKNFSEFMQTIKKLWLDKKIFLFSILISFLSIVINILGVQLLVNSFGFSISFVNVMVVVIISEFLGFYSAIPGGAGIAEASMIILLTFAGIGTGVAGAATLLNRLCFYIITYGLGYAALVYASLKYAG